VTQVRFERAILFGLPALAGVAVAFAVAGPGARRPVEFARVRGVVVAGASRVALRVEALRRYEELEAPAAGPVELECASEERVVVVKGEARSDGFVELAFTLERPLASTARLTIRRNGKVLARGEVRGRAALEEIDARRCETFGEAAEFEVCVPRGLAVPELPEQVTVTRRKRAEDASTANVTLEAAGAEVAKLHAPGSPLCSGGTCTESWAFSVTARAPAVPLDLEARVGGAVVAHHGDLPIQSGGLWLDPSWRSRGAILIRSSTPRTVAYASLVSREGRVWGGLIPLRERPNGGAEGALSIEEVPSLDAGPMTLVLASDPQEPAGRAVSWPLGPGRRVDAPPLATLLDGTSEAVAREESRMRAVRTPVVGATLVSAIAVLVTLVARARRAREALALHLAGRGVRPEGASSPLGLGLAVLAALAVAFAVLAVVAARR